VGGRRDSGPSFHPSQEVTEVGTGMMRLRLRLNNLEEVERWLVSFGSHATVVRPRALRERLRKAGEALVQQYAATAASDEPD